MQTRIGISFIGVSDTSLSFQITGATPVNYNRSVYWSLNGMNKTTYIYANSTSSGSVTFDGLQPGTSYTVKASVTGDYPWSSSRTVSTTGTPPIQRPDDWSWSVSEKNAFQNKGSINTLTYNRWNDFVQRVKDFASWFNNKEEDVYNVLSAKMTSNNKVLTATKFNIVKNAIGSMNATGISNVSKGSVVFGSYFITLSLKLGQISKSTELGTFEDLYNMDLLYTMGEIEDGNRSNDNV